MVFVPSQLARLHGQLLLSCLQEILQLFVDFPMRCTFVREESDFFSAGGNGVARRGAGTSFGADKPLKLTSFQKLTKTDKLLTLTSFWRWIVQQSFDADKLLALTSFRRWLPGKGRSEFAQAGTGRSEFAQAGTGRSEFAQAGTGRSEFAQARTGRDDQNSYDFSRIFLIPVRFP